MSDSLIMEQEDFIALKNREIASLHEELQRERLRRESAEREADMAFEQMRTLARSNAMMSKQISSWCSEVDEQIALRQQLERQGLDL
jgi:hypothetical protein